MILLPTDDSLDKFRDGDIREEGESDRKLVEEEMIPLPVDTSR
jgi:hypothetical protein